MNDDIEKFHKMWGGDGDDDKKKKSHQKPNSEPSEDESELGIEVAPSTLAGLSPLFMTLAPDAHDRPATDPVQWKAYEARFGFKPYPTPTAEYEQNENPLNRQTLLYRWAGLDCEKEIEMLFCDARSVGARARVQMQRKRDAGMPDLTDPASIKIETNDQINTALERIRALKHILELNLDITVEQYYRFDAGGTSYEEHFRPMNPTSRAKTEKDLREWIRTYRTLTNQDGKTVTHVTEIGTSFRDIMKQAMADSNHTTREGYTMAQLAEAKAQVRTAEIISVEVTETE